MKSVLKQLLFNRGIVKNGLVLWLEGEDFFNSPPTTTWGDRSGNRNNATPSGMAYTTSSGSDGVGGVVFDGVDDNAAITFPTNTFDNGITSSIVYKTSLLPSELAASTFMRLLWEVNDNFSLYYNQTTANAIVKFGTTEGAAIRPSIAQSYLFKDRYMEITVVYNLTTKLLSVYLNGILKNYVTRDGTSPIFSNPFYVSSTVGVLNGDVKSVKFYNRALTNSEIRQNYNASR